MKVKISEATHAVCKDCGHVVHPSHYWKLSSSVWLHENASGHKMEYRR